GVAMMSARPQIKVGDRVRILDTKNVRETTQGFIGHTYIVKHVAKNDHIDIGLFFTWHTSDVELCNDFEDVAEGDEQKQEKEIDQ
ncbi:MAG: hypothetical protein Q8M92_09015, partial [Candidatus Subteraquimicrobiales bacterium]|nr:hypothetical protein [Candidatus Subteraquimicrobiales bacterium]